MVLKGLVFHCRFSTNTVLHHRFPRQKLLSPRCLPGQRCNDYGILFESVNIQSFVSIRIRMIGDTEFSLVLDEGESRKANLVKRNMIRVPEIPD